MLSVSMLLALVALVWVVVHAATGRAPLWVAVLLLALIHLLSWVR